MPPRLPSTTAILPIACLIATSGVAIAGLVGGGVTHTWIGNIDNDWDTAGNWNTDQVPEQGDSVIVDSGPNVLLGSDSAELKSVYIGGGRSLSNHGSVLDVTNSLATTTVNGLDSTLFLTTGGSPYGFETNTLTVESDGRFQLSGGSALIQDQLTLTGDGRIVGNGTIDVNSANPAAFNGLNGSHVSVTGGDLHIGVFGGGSIAMPPAINILSAQSNLFIDGPLFLPINDLNLGENTSFNSASNWILDGTLHADPGDGNMATIGGDGMVTVGGHVSVTSDGLLRFDTQTSFESSSDVTIGAGATVDLSGVHTIDAGHVTTVQLGGRLLLEGLVTAGGWDGDIVSNAGIIESNNALGLRIDGLLHLGSVFNLRSVITGTSDVRVHGPVNAPGLGAIIESTLDVRPTAVMTLGANASLIVDGELILNADSTTFGNGMIDVQPDGELFIRQDASVSVDVVNDGDLHAGQFANEESVDLDGTYTQGAEGRMFFNISDEGADHYQIWNDVALDGTLHVVLDNGFVPPAGAEFEVLAANILSGSFDEVTGSPGFSVSYTRDTVILTFEGTGNAADLNGDGVVGPADLAALLASWGLCIGCPADLDGDSVVGPADLAELLANWG
jgi:hypothetical protein